MDWLATPTATSFAGLLTMIVVVLHLVWHWFRGDFK